MSKVVNCIHFVSGSIKLVIVETGLVLFLFVEEDQHTPVVFVQFLCFYEYICVLFLLQEKYV